MELRDEEAGTAGRLGDDLSLPEAARRYDVSLRTLRTRARSGRIAAYKVRGRWGHEWRVSERSLEASGLPRRAAPPEGAASRSRVAYLEEELGAVRRALSTERFRADRANRELGQAMLECGRLRSALAGAVRDAERCRGRTTED